MKIRQPSLWCDTRTRQAASDLDILKLSAGIFCLYRGLKRNGRVDARMDRLIKKRAKEGTREGCLPLVSSRGTAGVGIGGGGWDASWHRAQICN